MSEAVDKTVDAATRQVLATIDDPQHAQRYPNRTHFIPAGEPDHGEMAAAALMAGDPVALVYPDGREMLLTPAPARGIEAMFLLGALAWMRIRSHRHGGTLQVPPRTKIEARDSAGLPIAA